MTKAWLNLEKIENDRNARIVRFNKRTKTVVAADQIKQRIKKLTDANMESQEIDKKEFRSLRNRIARFFNPSMP